MKSTVSEVEDNKVKLLVQVDEQEFEKEVDAAFRRIAKEVRLPGFRPGKAPRKILEARLGAGYAREEALRESLPEYYANAVREHDVDVIAAPEIDITDGQEGGHVSFEAVVQVRPVVVVAGYQSMRVEIPSPEVSESDIDEYIDRLRNQHADLEPVDRPAEEGDHVTIDINGSYDGEPVPQLTAADYDYEVGMGAVVPELDENLVGSSGGATVTFSAQHPDPDEDGELEFVIEVKEVKAKVLPDVDDEFVAEVTEFETVDALRTDLLSRFGSAKASQAQMALREAVGDALADLVDDEIPDALVSVEMQNRLQDMAMRLQAQGMQLEQYLQMTGTDPEDFTAELREGAAKAATIDLALRAVVVAESIEVSDAELDEELTGLAERLGQDLETVRAQLADADQLGAIRSDLQKRNALEWLVEAVEIVDPEGKPIDRATLEPSEDEAEQDEPVAPVPSSDESDAE
ncbi:MAG: trigger factor [Acidimicrobiia bacterium]|nr:trigger factor [Acidimicrobiia bacterium]MDH5237702.1 trigger factor [Acidimicrobiia bacterium]